MHASNRRPGARTALIITAILAALGSALAAGAHAATGPRPQPYAHATAKAGYYEGGLGPYGLSFQLSGTKVTSLQTDYQVTTGSGCEGISGQEVTVRFAPMTVTDGKFHGATTSSGTTLKVSGTVKNATTITGRMSSSFQLKGFSPCAGSTAYTAQYVGASKTAAVSTLSVATGTKTATFTNITASFGSTQTDTPLVGQPGSAVISLASSQLTGAEQAALTGPITAAKVHLVLEQTPLVNATYTFSGVSTPTTSLGPTGATEVSFTYTDVKKT